MKYDHTPISDEEIEVLKKNPNAWPKLEHPVPRLISRIEKLEKENKKLKHKIDELVWGKHFAEGFFICECEYCVRYDKWLVNQWQKRRENEL